MPPQELFEIQSISSLTRQTFARQGRVTISSFGLDPFRIPADFVIAEHFLPTEGYGDKIKEIITPVVEQALADGYGNSILTAIYEALKNAHEHGNKTDSHKRITLAHRIIPSKLEVVVVDEGGEFIPDFAPFVLAQRARVSRGIMLNFYDFCGKTTPTEKNLGNGTSFMHLYMDDVRYYASERNGLVVLMTKFKN